MQVASTLASLHSPIVLPRPLGTCAEVCVVVAVGLVIPTSIALYLVELHARCKFFTRTGSTLVPALNTIMVQQAILPLAALTGLVICICDVQRSQ